MDVTILRVLAMFGIAFVISMFVALIIKLIYMAITSKAIIKYSDPVLMGEYKRAKRIREIRKKRIIKELNDLKKFESNEIIDYYYGDNKLTK